MYEHSSYWRYLKTRCTGFLRRELILYVTRRCNLSCAHCFVERGPDSEFSVPEYHAMADLLARFSRIRHMIITGGEPFLRPDLSEIIDFSVKKFRLRSLILNTNGYLTEDICRVAEKFLSRNKHVVLTFQFSLYGGRTVHDRICGKGGAFQNLQRSVKALLALGSKAGIKICCPVMTLNKDEHKNIVDFLETHHLTGSFSPLKQKLDNGHLDSRDQLSVGEYERFLSMVDAVLVDQDLWPLSNRLRNQAYLGIMRGKRYGWCEFPKRNIIVFPDGDYAFCEFSPAQGNLLADGTIDQAAARPRDCACLSYAYFNNKYLGRVIHGS